MTKDCKTSNNLYTIDYILDLFPRCTEFMVRNYRWKTGIGRVIDGIVHYTSDEITKFMEDTEFENIARRTMLYNYIKNHPGVKEEELHKYLPFSKQVIGTLLVDISQPEYMGDYPDLYEEDDGGLYVKGYEKVSKYKSYTKNEGIFYSVKRRKNNGKSNV